MLADFIEAHARQAWEPGRVDCLLALADWCLHLDYPDPGAPWRGTYDSEDGFRAIIERAGGVVPLADDGLSRIGIQRVTEPENGFIGIVGSRTNIQRQWGGIWDEAAQGWRVRMMDGYPAVKAHPLAIWSA